MIISQKIAKYCYHDRVAFSTGMEKDIKRGQTGYKQSVRSYHLSKTGKLQSGNQRILFPGAEGCHATGRIFSVFVLISVVVIFVVVVVFCQNM